MDERLGYRVLEVLTRTTKHRQQRERHVCAWLSVSSLMLSIVLIGVFQGVTSRYLQSMATIDAFGAVMLHEGVGGYILVGVVAFAAGTTLTIVSLWWRRRNRNKS